VEGGKQLVYGPVRSRRLGRSLGVDLVPFKVCSFNCVYCQLGPTTDLTLERKEYVPVVELVDAVAGALQRGPEPDYVTLAGSGEPTLHSKLSEIIRAIRELTGKPIAVLTNGSLLFEKEVRDACALADVVMPTLAAHDEAGYRRVHRACPELTLERHVSGLKAFRREHETPMWLELFVLEGVNASDADRAAFAALLAEIGPDRIQINTAVIAEVPIGRAQSSGMTEADVLELCRRRPCTLEQIADALGVHRNEVVKHVTSLLGARSIRSEWKDGREFFLAASR
jgi:wyosine [tRNA(Phe)-imidazoG37] synthetase (radical SAM superfamily)